MSSNSIKLSFDAGTDPKILEHRKNIEQIVRRLVGKVKQGPPVKISKYGFSHTLNAEDFDEMEKGFADWINNLDWRDVEEVAAVAKGLNW